MLGFLSKADELDWRIDPDYVAAVAVATTAKAEADRTEAERVAAWREDNIQGVNPPPDSRFWLVKGAANEAAQALADAIVVRDRAEATAKAAARQGWIDRYRGQWESVEHATDALLIQLTELDDARERAAAIGITLPWIAAGGMSVAALQHWKDGNRKLIEQLS